MSRIIFTISLFVVLLSALPALAQSDIGAKAVGPRLGYVKPSDIDGVFGFGAVLDLGTFAPRWGWDVSLDHWSRSEEFFLGKVKLSDWVIGTRARYEFAEVGAPTRPYAFAGLAIHIFTASVDFTDAGENSDSDTELGMDFGAGVDIAVSPRTDVFFEGGYRAVSDIGQWILLGGVMFALGQ